MTLSLDGPALLDDGQRQYRSGRGSYQKAINGLRLLQTHGIDHSVLLVVTSNTVKYPDEVYNWAVDHHIEELSFNPEETEGVNAVSSLHSTEHLTQYKAFLNQFLIRGMAVSLISHVVSAAS